MPFFVSRNLERLKRRLLHDYAEFGYMVLVPAIFRDRDDGDIATRGSATNECVRTIAKCGY